MPSISYNIRIDEELRDKAFPILESYGLTPAQAFKLFLHQVSRTGKVPLSFDYQNSDAAFSPATLKAFDELKNGEYSESTLKELLNSKEHV